MIWKIGMPNLGHTMSSGRVQRWLKQPGEAVRKGEAIALVESDKVSVEIESPADGRLLHVLVPAESDAAVGGTIGLVGRAEEAAQAETMATELLGAKAVASDDTGSAPPPSASDASSEQSAQNKPRRRATPLANRIARQNAIDIGAIRGSGPKGMVVMADVLQYQERRREAENAPARDEGSPSGEGAGVPLSQMRAAIATRMARIWHEAPMVTLVATADVTELAASPVAAAMGLKINDLVMCACARSLARNQRVNAWFVDGRTRYHEAVHLAFAVALDDGLVTPVIRDADGLAADALGREARRLARAARADGLTVAEASGATFTVTNLGGLEIDFFTPILNPPQVGILGVGRVRQEATPTLEGIGFRRVLSLCLVFDHRALDGADGARFLQDVRALLATPRALLAPPAPAAPRSEEIAG